MSLPFNLQKLPSEALDVLRYLGKAPAGNADEIQAGTGLSGRTVGRAVRRLVNYDYIALGADGRYQLTTDGKIAVQQIADHDAGAGAQPDQQKKSSPQVQRRLAVVLPRTLVAGRPADLYIGVNPPSAGNKLPGPTHIELKVSSVGGSLSSESISLEVPPDKAAAPCKVSLTPTKSGRTVRVRIDAFQSFTYDSLEPLGGMYFDVQVASDATENATRAVGMDLMLKPPR